MLTPRPEAVRASDGLVLYCLAHAGGSAAPYARWTATLPEWVRVEPVELPGHGTRLREPVPDRLDLVVAEAVRGMRVPPDTPFAVFGHSFGALVAYEATRRLVSLGTPPAALLASGRNAPGEPLSHRPLHGLPDTELVTALSHYGGMPAELVAEPELLRAYLPVIRNDLRIAETYTRSPGPPLGLPVTVFGGRRDWLTDVQGLAAWEQETAAEFDLTLLPEGHFFPAEPGFPRTLAARLARLTGPPPGPGGGTPPAAAGAGSGRGRRPACSGTDWAGRRHAAAAAPERETSQAPVA